LPRAEHWFAFITAFRLGFADFRFTTHTAHQTSGQHTGIARSAFRFRSNVYRFRTRTRSSRTTFVHAFAPRLCVGFQTRMLPLHIVSAATSFWFISFCVSRCAPIHSSTPGWFCLVLVFGGSARQIVAFRCFRRRQHRSFGTHARLRFVRSPSGVLRIRYSFLNTRAVCTSCCKTPHRRLGFPPPWTSLPCVATARTPGMHYGSAAISGSLSVAGLFGHYTRFAGSPLLVLAA